MSLLVLPADIEASQVFKLTLNVDKNSPSSGKTKNRLYLWHKR